MVVLASLMAGLVQQAAHSQVITLQPSSQVVAPGSTAVFRVAVSGDGPFDYQWLFYGTSAPGNVNTISTIAGTGQRTDSGDGGPAVSASIYSPYGLAVDSVGNLYTADASCVRRIGTNGIISTFAGQLNNAGFAGDGGPAVNAFLSEPIAIAFDAVGNLFISDIFNYRIRKVDTNGVITTVAGTGSPSLSGDGGLATEAGLGMPYGIALDRAGNLYVTIPHDNLVRKVATNGIITTFAGNGDSTFAGDGGPATDASLYEPNWVALDPAGNLLIVDEYNLRLRKVATNGIITTVAGGGMSVPGDGGLATNAKLSEPFALCTDAAGNAFFTDLGVPSVRMVNAKGSISTVAGNGVRGYSGDGGPGTNASLNFPTGITKDSLGNIFIADSGANVIRKVRLGGDPATLVINNVCSTNVGAYQVVVRGPSGAVTSLLATLTLPTPTAPIVLGQPASQSLTYGSIATLDVACAGDPPLAFQWQFNGTSIDGATNRALTIGPLGIGQFGEYKVIVSNGSGSVASAPATLGLPPLVWAWGDNESGETNVPPSLTDALAVSAGRYYSIALKLDGTVVAWGDNSREQTDVSPGLRDVIGIAACSYYAAALKADGTVVAWGNDPSGTSVPPGLSDVVAIATGSSWGGGNGFGLALKQDGTITGWGDNSLGQLNIPSSLTNVVGVAAGAGNAMALRSDGTVVAWGDNYYGRNNVPHGLSNVVAIAAGWQHGVALTSAGRVVCWGDNSFGQTTMPRGVTNIAAIAAGALHTLALRADGSVISWGYDGFRQTDLPLGLSNVVAIAGGGYHSLAVLHNGAPRILRQPFSHVCPSGSSERLQVSALAAQPCSYQWRFNGTEIDGATNASLVLADLGVGSQGAYTVVLSNALGAATSAAAILQVVPMAPTILSQPDNLAALAGEAGSFSVQALGSLPLAYQWWFNGVPLPGETNSTLTIARLRTSDSGTYSVVITNAYGRIVSSDAWLRSTRSVVVGWGSNGIVEDDDGGQIDVPPGLLNPRSVSGGSYFSLALKDDGAAVAWGENGKGQTSVPPGLTNLIAIAAGDDFALALEGNGTIVGWGGDPSGLNVPAGLSNVVAIAAGSTSIGGLGFGFALGASGTVTGWGDNSVKQLQIPANLADAAAICAGGGCGLALRANGTVAAWGDNSYGQTNVPPGLTNVVAIAAGSQHCVALTVDGTLVCWGDNSLGQTSVPDGATNVVAIAAGAFHTLALRMDGTVVGWGYDLFHQASVPAGLSNVVALAGGGYHSLAIIGDGSPVIVRPPVGRVAQIGTSPTFSVIALGAPPLAYQWLHNGAPLAGETRSTLSLDHVANSQAGTYSVVVTNSAGSAISGTATLSLFEPLTVVAPLSTQVATAGSSVTLTVEVVGGLPIGYQWLFNGAPLIEGGRASGTTTPALILSGLQPADSGGYTLVATNASGAVSCTALLTVTTPPPAVGCSVAPDTSRYQFAGLPTVVGVSGASFTPNTSIAFTSRTGSLYPASVVLDSAAHLTASLPGGTLSPGTYSILVFNPGTPPVTLANAITLLDPLDTPYLANLHSLTLPGGQGVFSMTIAGGLPGELYDLYVTTNLTDKSLTTFWTWLGQGISGSSLCFSNLPSTAFFILGKDVDSSHAGFTDAFQWLVTKTDPFHPASLGDGLADAWKLENGMDPRLSESTQPQFRRNYAYDAEGKLIQVFGIQQATFVYDSEGNILLNGH